MDQAGQKLINEQRALTILCTERADAFLADWIRHLAIAMRDPERATVQRLSSVREVTLVLATQLASRLDHHAPAYPAEALLQTVREKAAAYDCLPEVTWAARQALDRSDNRNG